MLFFDTQIQKKMPSTLTDTGEDHLALIAGPQLFPGMIVHMDFQLVRSGFSDSAHRTYVVLDSFVTHCVLFQFVFRDVSFGAIGAGVW